MDQTFTLLPLTLDPTTNAITSPLPSLSPLLTQLTTLHRALVPLPSQTPPPPLPTNPKRTAQVQKMRDQGASALRRASSTPSSSSPTPATALQESIKLYTYALEMALGRPGWEPASLVRDEASSLFSNRAQAHIQAGMWPEGAADAQCSVELKKGPGNGKAWAQRGKCLLEMGRWEEAREWVREGREVEGGGGKEGGGEGGGELEKVGREVERFFTEERGGR